MKLRRVALFALLPCLTALLLLPSTVDAQGKFVVTAITEKKIKQLPPGPLYWEIENFPTLARAQAAASETSLAAEVWGKVWLFTLGPKDGPTHGGSKIAEIGPIPPITAPEYMLRINTGQGPPGAKTSVHMHPGAETFYVLTGQLGQKTPHGVHHVEAGQSMPGHSPGMPMQVFNSGTSELNTLVMFVVDATKPFSSPARFE
jgi:hypothetical protein